MTETVGLDKLKELAVAAGAGSAPSASGESVVTPKEPVLDKLSRAYGTGRRKTAKARLWLKSGAGRLLINGKEVKDYFPQETLRMHLDEPLRLLGAEGRFDVMCTVKGSGKSGQAGAVRHALARALVQFKPDSREKLKPAGMMTRDPRAVERKKYGQPKARKRFQFSKR
jgi:small subunit ribosomal protein S9